MKSIKYLSYALTLGLVLSCTNEEVHYKGDPFLSFISQTSQQLVDQGSGSKVVEVEYGTIAKVSNAEVKLVVDESSQLKEGTDFEILGTSNPSGNFDGKVSIKLLESGASPVGKNAVFRLASPTIKNGISNQLHTMTVSLKCPLEYFLEGSFRATINWFGGTYSQDVVQGSEPNTILLKDYYAAGYDIKLTYDPSTGVILPFTSQATGYNHATYGAVSLRSSGTSTINFCTRTIRLGLQPFVSAGNFAAHVDVIQGS